MTCFSGLDVKIDTCCKYPEGFYSDDLYVWGMEAVYYER